MSHTNTVEKMHILANVNVTAFLSLQEKEVYLSYSIIYT